MLLSWNILAPIYAQCKYYDNINPTFLTNEYRFKKIGNILSSFKPKIICLQEVQEISMILLKEYMDDYHEPIFIPHDNLLWNDWYDGSYVPNGNAIYVHKSLKIDNYYHVDLSCDGNVAILFIINGITILNCHLEVNNINGMRNEQIQKIIQMINNNIIIVGDFNTSDIQLFTKSGVVSDGVTYPTCYGRKIDHILGTKNTKIKLLNINDLSEYGINREICIEMTGSDHLPVIADFLLS